MVWLGVICGAVVGWIAGNFGLSGLVLGAIAGGPIGVGLKRAIQTEIRTILKLEAEAAAHRQTSEIEAPAARPSPEVGPSPAVPQSPTPTPTRVPAPMPQVSSPPPTFHSPQPPRDSAIQSMLEAARSWLLGGNTIVRAGLVILFIGLSFLARWAAQHDLFPVELRLALVTLVGLALLAFGYSRRVARPAFALALQGTGIAAIYLALFAGARLFHVIPPLPAFAVMIVVCALGCALALLQNAQPLALASFLGGFAVPILLSDGSGNSLVLFSYYAVLNLAVLAIAHFRAWRLVSLVGFFATFGVATAWGALSYKPAEYAMAQPFLIGFVLNYIVAALLYARNTAGKLGSFVDSTLLFGPALVGFGLQVGLVRHLELGSAFSALGFGAAYLALVFFARRKSYGQNALLAECMLAIALGFLTLAIPLALGAKWTSSAWALEGAGVFWVGSRQSRWMPRAFGLALMVVAALVFLSNLDSVPSALAFLNPAFMGAALIAGPLLAVAWWLRKPLPHSGSRLAQAYVAAEIKLASPAFLVGFGFWALALGLEAARKIPAMHADGLPAAVFSEGIQRLLFMTGLVVSAAFAAEFGRRVKWQVGTWPAHLTLLPIVLVLLRQMGGGEHVLYLPDLLLWLVTLGAHFAALYASERDDQASRAWQKMVHIGSIWMLTFWLADCLVLGIDEGKLRGTSWAGVIMLFSASLVLAGLTATANRGSRIWPLKQHGEAYFWTAAIPLAVLVFFGGLGASLLDSGRTAPLPYVPLLNPLELALGIGLAILVLWRRTVLAKGIVGSAWLQSRMALGALALLAFVMASTVWLRIAHHYLNVPWTRGGLTENFIVQTGLAILWTVLALALMVLAHKRLQRSLWLVGAGLLALVVVKLLLVDLANAGGGERVVTFMAVGVLMLITGYFAPLPPALAKKDEGQ